MLLGYFKAEPTEYAMVYVDGRVTRAGLGLAGWYWAPRTSIVLVPSGTVDVPFALTELTGNFQPVTVQGQVTYRVADPARLAGLLNFTINPVTRVYRSEDPDKLGGRIVNVVQMHARNRLAALDLQDALRGGDALAAAVLAATRLDPVPAGLGVECLSLFFTSIRPAPDMAKALEAEAREQLQRRADEAIYARRAAAVEQERAIKQNELATQVDLEQRRRTLVDLQGENARREALTAAEATRIGLEPFAALDPRLVLGLAFRDFAANAQKIGNLTITSAVLEELLQGGRRG